MKQKKKLAMIANLILFLWFFLDMIGISIGNKVLVSEAWKDDGIFMIIYIASCMLYILREKIGKYILTLWLTLWFVAQFMFHWFVSITGPWEGKIKYFADTIKLFPSTNRYLPDLYHIVLHILLLFALISTSRVCLTRNNRGVINNIN